MPDMQAIRDCFQNDRFAAAIGMELIEVRPGYARAQMPLEERHMNLLGIGHGGATFALADMAFAAACMSGGQQCIAVHMSMSCVKAAVIGPLQAEAQEISRGRKIANCTVRITDGEGDLIAFFQGTAYLGSGPFPPEGEK
jgi:acyl-CoA thioesterase